LLFYVNRPQIDRNYGGVSVCFRWLLWFAPLWLLVIGPVMDWFGTSGRRRAILLAMLALSVFSMSMALATPWQSPWLYRFWQFLGWINV
jgi:MFS family permease